ncbi:amidohydrolase family protein [uncultured Clostridium sp.]|uniref:amidohydrolase family protein n=1 Tax=uncultured Clostridium sp. TaxID=59620 RepID=UPI002637BBC9|nr:amidohydrolase family protein [uncultured Clostridium sp.]
MNKYSKIDIHHHIIPSEYIQALKEYGISDSAGLNIHSTTAEDSIKFMDANNIDIAICSISEPVTIPFKDKEKASALSRKLNEIEKSYIDKYPTRFGAFASLPLPFIEESLEEIHYALDILKLDGIGLLSNYEDKFLGDPIFDPIFEELNKRKATVFIHPSVPPKTLPRPYFIMADFVEEFVFNTTRAATNLILSGTLERFPDIKIILAHAGGTLPYLKFRIENTFKFAKALSSSNQIKKPLVNERYNSVTKDVSFYINKFYYDLALSIDNSVYSSLASVTSLNHILFGSDANYAPPSFPVEAENSLTTTSGFDKETISNIFFNNSLELFSRFKK